MKERVVLIVEEDEEIIDAIGEDLLDYQFQTALASDLNEAMNIMMKAKRDIAMVICDASIEDGNGAALKEQMIDARIKVPFILIAEDLTSTLEDDARRLNIREVLVKPIDLDIIREIIENLDEVA